MIDKEWWSNISFLASYKQVFVGSNYEQSELIILIKLDQVTYVTQFIKLV